MPDSEAFIEGETIEGRNSAGTVLATGTCFRSHPVAGRPVEPMLIDCLTGDWNASTITHVVGLTSGAVGENPSGTEPNHPKGTVATYYTSVWMHDHNYGIAQKDLALDCKSSFTARPYTGTRAVVNCLGDNREEPSTTAHNTVWGSLKSLFPDNHILWYVRSNATVFGIEWGSPGSAGITKKDFAAVCCEFVCEPSTASFCCSSHDLVCDNHIYFQCTFLRGQGLEWDNKFNSWNATNALYRNVVTTNVDMDPPTVQGGWVNSDSYYKHIHSFDAGDTIRGIDFTVGGTLAGEYVLVNSVDFDPSDFTPKSTAPNITGRVSGNDILLQVDVVGRMFIGAIGAREKVATSIVGAGSVVFSGTALATVFGPFSLKIAGVERKDLLSLESFNLSEEVNGRNDLEFLLVDRTGALHPSIGQIVECRLKGDLIFAGKIEEIDESVPDDATAIFLRIKCADWNALADQHIVANRFTVPGQTIFDVVSGIVNTYSGDAQERLLDDGVIVTPTSVASGPVLGVVTFNYSTAKEAFDDIAELTGYIWNIGYDKILVFKDRTSFKAPFNIDLASFTNFRKARIHKKIDKYRNIQYLRAGKDITDDRVQEFLGDGEVTSFELALPVAEGPGGAAAPRVFVNGVEKTVEIREKEGVQAQWYYQKDDENISQDSSETILTATDILRVEYRGFFPIITKLRAEEEIIDRKAVEGGSGVYVDVENDEKIDSSELAEERTANLIRKYGRLPTFLEFETLSPGFHAGQMLKVNLPEYGLANVDFMIDRLAMRWMGLRRGPSGDEDVYLYSIRAIDGEALDNSADFFQRLSTQGRPFIIRENESLLLIRSFPESFNIHEAVLQISFAEDQLGHYRNDTASRFLIGRSVVGKSRYASAASTVTGFYAGPLIGMPLFETAIDLRLHKWSPSISQQLGRRRLRPQGGESRNVVPFT